MDKLVLPVSPYALTLRHYRPALTPIFLGFGIFEGTTRGVLHQSHSLTGDGHRVPVCWGGTVPALPEHHQAFLPSGAKSLLRWG